jgi:uncharacterized membrane protein (UPF0127 family)
MRTMTIALFLSLVLSSCAGSDPSPAGVEDPSELNRGTALIDTDGASALLYVVVAETEAQREAAFASTASLEDDEGLAFLYFEPTTETFEMEGRFDLSVAFFDVDGVVVEVLDVEPCLTDGEECPTYDPGVSYLGALSVKEGVFDRIGVGEGAVVEIVPGTE